MVQVWNSIYNSLPVNGQQVICKIEAQETIKVLVFEIFKPASVGSINCEFKDDTGTIYPVIFWMTLPSLPVESLFEER